ncbi:sialidase-4 [Ambystoma mexicanum]|uniref:sialidase-4 n=1 Tax=Ambystoma mexicanum TaxID=8296 RepID=UPI0037E914C0
MGSRYFPARTVLFEKERNGVTYRVPSLLYVPRSATLLAFAEERLSADDAHANLLVLRQGTFYKTYVEWGDLRAINTALLKNHRSMNPCPLYDDFTGTVFLFFIAVLGKIPESYQIITGHNLARLCYVSSSDQGNTWSAVTDLTKQVIGGSIKEWATFALGPGHGIQLKCGRLVIPAYAYHIDCTECFGKFCKTTPHSFTFYSDDHGKNWKFGDFIPNLKTVECQVAAVDEEDGTNVLYCNARSPLGFRVQALSTDRGAGFNSGQLVQKLVESQNGCHGSIIGFPAPFDIPLFEELTRLCSLHVDGQTMDIQCQSLESLCSIHLGNRQQQYRAKEEFLLSCHGEKVFEDIICGDTLLKESVHGRTVEDDRSVSECCANEGSVPNCSPAKTHCILDGNPKPSPCTRLNALFQNPTWVLYCHPTSPISRVNLGVYLSTFPRDADSWTDPWVIYEGPSAYSDMAYIELPSSTASYIGAPTIAFACLFENGVRSPYEQISFSIFTLYELMQNIPRKSTSELISSLCVTSANNLTQHIPMKTTAMAKPNVPKTSHSNLIQNICVKPTPQSILNFPMEFSIKRILNTPVNSNHEHSQIIPSNWTSNVLQYNPRNSTYALKRTVPVGPTSKGIGNITMDCTSEAAQGIPMKNSMFRKCLTKTPFSSHRKSQPESLESRCLLS